MVLTDSFNYTSNFLSLYHWQLSLSGQVGVIPDQPFHRALHNLADGDSRFLCGFLQYFSVIIGDRTDEMCRILCVVILHHVSLQKSDEAVEYQSVDARLFQMLCDERGEACQKTVGERRAIDSVNDFGSCQVELLEKCLFHGWRQLVFQNITDQ